MLGRYAALAAACAVGLTCATLTVSTLPAPQSAGVVALDHQDAAPAVRCVLVRSSARDLVAKEVIAGRMVLPDAAARFGWLNALPPPAPPAPTELLAVRVGLPGDEWYTEGERLALQVVAWVERPFLSDDPERARQAAVRQFVECRADGRLVRLPEVPECERARLLAEAQTEATALSGLRPGVSIRSRRIGLGPVQAGWRAQAIEENSSHRGLHQPDRPEASPTAHPVPRR
jgi:hypothetical protein